MSGTIAVCSGTDLFWQGVRLRGREDVACVSRVVQKLNESLLRNMQSTESLLNASTVRGGQCNNTNWAGWLPPAWRPLSL